MLGMISSKPKKEAPDNKIARTEDNATVILPSYHSGNLGQLEEMVKSMMEKGHNKHADGKTHFISAKCVERRARATL